MRAVFLILLAAGMFAQEITIKAAPGRSERFLPAANVTGDVRTRNAALVEGKNRYFKNGIVSESTLYESRGVIVVGLVKEADPAQFGAAYGLTKPHKVTEGIFRFQNGTDEGDLALCARIGDDSRVTFAKPAWITRKQR